MSKFVVRDNVPILDEHTLKDDDGNVLVKFDEAKLRHIAERNNTRIKETGDLIPLVIGHTKDGEPETKQPVIVGYAKDLRVRPFKKTGRKAIHAKFLFFKDKVDQARNFPRRSIELWLSDGKIDPISLLGATTPERDLGLVQLEKAGAVVQLSANGKRKYKRLLDAEPRKESPMDEKAIIEGVLKALEQSAVWKWAESQMKEQEDRGSEGELDEGLPGEEGDMDMEAEGEELPADLEGESHEGEEPSDEEEADLEEEPVRYNAGASAPSGSNTHTPAMGAHNRNPSNMHHKKGTSNNNVQKKGHLSMSRSSNGSDRLVRFQKAIRQVRQENEQLRLKFQRAERERDLLELAAQGYEFDPSEELDYCQQLPDDHYQYHLNRIKKRYQRAPVGDPRFDLSSARSPQPMARGDERTRDQAKAIAEYAYRKGISYEDALTQFDGEQTF